MFGAPRGAAKSFLPLFLFSEREGAGRKQQRRQRFPLAWQGRGRFSARRKIRSGLAGPLSRRNTASHRCQTARVQGAPPRPAPGKPGRLYVSLPTLLSVKEIKNRRTPMWESARSFHENFLRWHYPHQVKGSKRCFLSAFRLPCFSRPLWHFLPGLSRGFSVLFLPRPDEAGPGEQQIDPEGLSK